MGQAKRTRKADDPALRSEIEELRRAGQPLDRKAIAARHGVGEGTVTVVRSEIDAMLAGEAGRAGPADHKWAGRTVREFDGGRLLEARRHTLLMQDQLGEIADVSRGEIGHLERNQRKPTLRTLKRLGEALEIDPNLLLGTTDRSLLTEALSRKNREKAG